MVVEGYEMLVFYEGIHRYLACRWSRGVEGGVTFKGGLFVRLGCMEGT